mgnify:CR=1 FL=1
MKDGKIDCIGTFDELCASGVNFNSIFADDGEKNKKSSSLDSSNASMSDSLRGLEWPPVHSQSVPDFLLSPHTLQSMYSHC